MSRHIKDMGFSFGGDDETEEVPLFQHPGFKLVRRSEDWDWALVHHIAMREERWVLIADIRLNGIRVAYYDADPSFLPKCEHRPEPRRRKRRR